MRPTENTVLRAGPGSPDSAPEGFPEITREQAGEDAQTRSVAAAKAATELGVQQYRTGVIDFNRVFNLETTQVQQQDQLAVAAGNIALNLVNVYRALGGGWELRLQTDKRCAVPTTVAAMPGGPQAAPPRATDPEGLQGPARSGPREEPAAPGPDPLPPALPDPRAPAGN